MQTQCPLRLWIQTLLAPAHSHSFRDPQSKETKNFNEMPRSLPAAIPTKARGKSKGNRSVRCIPGGNEAIWDDELHAALIEGISFWPPTTKRMIMASSSQYLSTNGQTTHPTHAWWRWRPHKLGSMSAYPAVPDTSNWKESYTKANIKSNSKTEADASGWSREYVAQRTLFTI